MKYLHIYIFVPFFFQYGRQPSYYLDGQNESTLRQLRDGSTLNGLRKIKPRYYGQVSAGQPFTNSNSKFFKLKVILTLRMPDSYIKFFETDQYVLS